MRPAIKPVPNLASCQQEPCRNRAVTLEICCSTRAPRPFPSGSSPRKDDAASERADRRRAELARGAGLGAKARRGAASAGRKRRHRRGLARDRQRGLGDARRRCSPARCRARSRRAIIASPRRFQIPSWPTLAWLAGSYRFGRYKIARTARSRSVSCCPTAPTGRSVLALAEALYFGRDLINTPANDLGPAELETAARELGTEHGATVKVTEGSSLLSDNFPMIHAVGRASDRAPRLIDLRWGSERAPKVTIVGKGICFDTGGLDIKPGSAMALMKKDMGGAASALAFAHLVMQAKLPVRLRVLIPAADNSIAGNAFRPGDVLREPERHDRRDRQHRRRRPPRARRCHEPRRRGGAGLSRHHRHAHRRGARRARAGPAAALYRRRRFGRGPARERRARRRSALAHAALGALRQAAQEQHRRREPYRRRLASPAR